jgi:hypothetical protein
MVERFNRTLENQLIIFVQKHQQDWDNRIPLILLAYRSAMHESTGQTPSCLMFGTVHLVTAFLHPQDMVFIKILIAIYIFVLQALHI